MIDSKERRRKWKFEIVITEKFRRIMRRYFLLIGVVFIVSTICSQNSVKWENLKNVNISGSIISKGGGTKAQTTSINILAGSYDENYNNGFFSFTNKGALNQLKTIGYTLVESGETGFEQIEYGFAFSVNKLRAYGKESFAEINLAADQELKIERVNENMNFYVNNNLIYQEIIDISEYLAIRAQLFSANASFDAVQASFTSERPIIDPRIFPDTKTIDLNLTKNYSFIRWEDGDKGTIVKKYIQDNFSVELYDDQARKFKRTYSIGTEVQWENLNGTVFSGTSLSKNSGNNWGTALSNSVFSSEESFWFESSFISQTETKAIGLVSTKTNLQNIGNIVAGFLISKDYQLEIIYEGKSVRTIEAYDNDRLTISNVKDKISWLLNGMVVFEAANSTKIDMKVGALLKLGTELKQVQFAKTQTFVTSEWDNISSKGSIKVDISSISGIQAPFFYLLSEEEFGPSLDQYKYLIRDNNTGSLSQALFNGKGEQKKEYQFDNLAMKEYHLAVYNADGTRILGKHITIKSELALLYNQGIEFSQDKIKSTIANAKGEFNMVLSDNGNVEFIVNDKTSNLSIGLIDAEKQIGDLEQVDFGFSLKGGKLSLVKNGVESTQKYPIKKESILSIESVNSELILKVNGKERERILIDRERPLKGGVIIEQPEKEIKLKKWDVVPLISTKTKVISGNCETNNVGSTFEFYYTKNIGIYNFNVTSITLYNEQNQAISPTIVNSTTAGFTYVFANLPLGLYSISYTYTIASSSPFVLGTYTLSGTQTGISVGYPMEWTNLSNSVHEDIDESINNTTTLNNSQLGYATTDKEAESLYLNNERYWIDFQVELNLPISEIIFIGDVGPGEVGSGVEGPIKKGKAIIKLPRETYNLWESTQSETNGFADQNKTLTFINFEGVYNMVLPNFTSLPFSPADKFRVIFDATGLVEFYQNGNLVTTFQEADPVLLVNALLEDSRNSFHHVYTNLPCKKINIYAKLARELTGVKYKPFAGKVYFYYQEEYADLAPNLNFKVYNVLDNKVPVMISSTSITNYKYGDNRYALDVNTLPAGAYTLEVENGKKEKFYLRFVK